MNLSAIKYNITYFKFYCKGLYLLFLKKEWKKKRDTELVRILKYAIVHSKYIRNSVGLSDEDINEENVIESLKKFPTITKQTIIEKQWEIYSDEVPYDYQNWRETGGSTGQPLRYPALASSYYLEDVCQMILYHQMGFHWGDTIVYFGGDRVAEEKVINNIYWFESNNLPYGKFIYCIRYLNEETFPYYVESLNKVAPKFVRGYTSSVKQFCRLVKKNKTHLQFKLKGIYLTSESATQKDRDYIESILQCPVWGQYGHTECSVFAVSKPHDSKYFTNPLYGYTEILDSDGNQVPVGAFGEITVTGFNIIGMPFVRYRTGDMAIYGGETKYGETILMELLGRSMDFLYDNDGNKVYALSLLFDASNLNLLDYIKVWQIVQNEDGKIFVKIVRDDLYNDEIEKAIKDVFAYKNISVSFMYVDEIPMTSRGKHKFIIQRFEK